MSPERFRRIANGPQAVIGLDDARRTQDAPGALWPFPWVYPPAKSERRSPSGYIVMPVAGTTEIVLQFPVPTGFQFDLERVMFCAVTTGMVPICNPGDLLYSINRNTITPGTTAPQQSPLADFNNIPFSWGSPAFGPVKLSRTENFQSLNLVTLYVQNVSFGGDGAPNYVVGMFEGWQRKA